MKRSIIFGLSLVMLLGGCSSGGSTAGTSKETSAAEPADEGAMVMTEEEVTIPSRENIMIPGTVTLPAGKDHVPFVILCHGHGGDRHENGGLDAIADRLAANGIASIRVDYPGCGESAETFDRNNMTNMDMDTESAIQYMEDHYPVDTNKAGIFGYSMGGRIALELLGEGAKNFSAVVLLAPAADTEDLKNLFGGAENWEKLKESANESDDKWVEYTTIYGQKQHLGAKWFADLEAKNFEDVVQKAADHYSLPSLVIYAVDDAAVSPAVSQGVADALHAEVVKTPEDGHGYGFYGGPAYVKRIVVENTVDFFVKNLK